MNKPHFLALDGLRGIAAIAVMVMHKGRWLYEPGGFIGHAWMAVDFFFLLSGFVIAAAYEERLRGGLSVPAFLRIRMIRLYPLILLGMLIGGAWPLMRIAVGDYLGPDAGPVLATLARGVLLIPAVHPDPTGWGLFPLNGPTWSLFFELAVNIAYVLIARRLTTPILIGIVAVAALAVAAMPFAAGLDAGAQGATFWWAIPRTTFGFFAGVLLYRTRGRWAHLVPGAPVWLLSLALVGVFVIPADQPWTPAFELACVFLVFPALLALGVNAPSTPRTAAFCRLSGGLSYPIYALHYPLLVLAGGIIARRIQAPWLGLVAYPIVFALCWAAWRLYDEPVRAWLSGLGRARLNVRSSPPAAAG